MFTHLDQIDHRVPLDDEDLPGRAGRFLICVMYDLYGLAHVAGWEPYNLPNLGDVSWAGYVLYRSCTTNQNGRLGSIWSVDDLDRDLSDL